MERNENWKSSWRVRRRFMFAVSAFCMWVIGYVLYRDLGSSPADTAITMAFLTLISIVGSYVFGATWEDVSLAKAKLKMPAGNTGKPAPASGASTKMEDIP
ncbi:hypothetical protein P9A54_gp43 [Xanthomonas phage vB_Xar_IVIA-DoCa10]|uniref:Uncharacterized protein n=1 Tax=Xanthomonas phage vB_Xar_IVIA-DoCa10 TaxID=2975529 RepID=A0A9X9JNZ2_9CAUD|nr:hypothetical protein P9A54_gp43 [Xanthomonas phage vB_Xar_IVIA-DoCa10]UYA99028.1 hypothetical protein IVIADoCa10_43 [Xanthomonas phage vB_Xar_IVIA-DoCa10]